MCMRLPVCLSVSHMHACLVPMNKERGHRIPRNSKAGCTTMWKAGVDAKKLQLHPNTQYVSKDSRKEAVSAETSRLEFQDRGETRMRHFQKLVSLSWADFSPWSSRSLSNIPCQIEKKSLWNLIP